MMDFWRQNQFVDPISLDEPENKVDRGPGQWAALNYLDRKEGRQTEYLGGIVLAVFSFLIGGLVTQSVLYFIETFKEAM